jgi:endonuclease III
VRTLGGRFSLELGIDVDVGPDEVERWFLAATLFGTRISAGVAMRAYRELAADGVRTIADVGGASWEELVALLDAGGYVRYDFRTASRLQELERIVRERYGGRISVIGATSAEPAAAEAALDALPGWGQVTTRLFLRELRGVWPAARPPSDPRARWAAAHLGWRPDESEAGALDWLESLARAAGVDARDLEAGLVRLALGHGRGRRACPGGDGCRVLAGDPGRGSPA